jgi:hypothetical protein
MCFNELLPGGVAIYRIRLLESSLGRLNIHHIVDWLSF